MQCVFLSGQILVFFPPSLGHTVIFSVRSQWLVVDWGPAWPSAAQHWMFQHIPTIDPQGEAIAAYTVAIAGHPAPWRLDWCASMLVFGMG